MNLLSHLKLSDSCIDLNYLLDQLDRGMNSAALRKERIRSFVAVDIDNPSILSAVTAVQQDLRATGADLKMVDPQNMHLTIWFLGEIPRQTLERVKDALSGVRFNTFSLRVAGVGYFPGGRSVQVIWAGVEDPDDQLSHIYGQLRGRLAPLGFKPDRRGFSPHFTVARVRGGRGREALLARIGDIRAAALGVQRVDSVKLKRSVLTPKGPIYSDIYAVAGE